MQDVLRAEVLHANQELERQGLAVLTWGNASGFDPAAGVVAIKPSGVPYAELTAGDLVLVDLEGRVVEGARNPSSDLPTHLALYRAWPEVRGVVHTHSAQATIFAQARRGIPCYGTTHADHFRGEIPCTRMLREADVRGDYEAATGAMLVECLGRRLPLEVPGALVAGHGPFAWGAGVAGALQNAIVLEQVARMALGTLCLAPGIDPIPAFLSERHFLRKHGPCATYGQHPPR